MTEPCGLATFGLALKTDRLRSQSSVFQRQSSEPAVLQSAVLREQRSDAPKQDDDAAEFEEGEEVLGAMLVARHESAEVEQP